MLAKKQYERKEIILKELQQKGHLSTEDICTILNVSPATARRFTQELAAEGSILRVHGGIRVLANNKTSSYSYNKNTKEYAEEKRRIAEYAVSMIRDNDTVFLETGTTVYQCAIVLASRLQEGILKNITVFTNSLPNLRILTPHTKTVLVGGIYRPELEGFIGNLCERFLRSFYFNRTIIGADAIHPEHGLMSLDFDTARIDEILLQQSENVAVVAHSAKFHENSLMKYADLHDVHAIITDRGLSDKNWEIYKSMDVPVIRV